MLQHSILYVLLLLLFLRSCKSLVLILDAIEYEKKMNRLSGYRTKNKIHAASKNLEIQLEIYQFEKEQLIKKKHDALKNIHVFRKAIDDRLDELEQNSIAEIEDKYNNLINEVEEGIGFLNVNSVTVAIAKAKMEAAGDAIQKFIATKVANKIADSATEFMESGMACFEEVFIDFIGDQKMLALSEEINALGKVIQRSTKEAEVITITEYHPLSLNRLFGTGSGERKEDLIQVKRGEKNAIFMNDLEECLCEIISACALKDGTIILSDYNNRRLKCLDRSSYCLRDYFDLPGKPWEVCTVSAKEVAVCMPHEEQIIFISIDDKIQTNKITTGFSCWGLDYSEGNLYVTDFKQSVYIYSLSGRKLKQFVADQTGSPLFSMICSLKVNATGTRIYVTDSEKGLIVIDNSGRIVKKFNDPRLKGAHGSFLTDKGSLLVCGCASKNVLQFGQDGDLIGEVLTLENASYCKMVCYNHHRSKMIVGRTEYEIEVYDLV